MKPVLVFVLMLLPAAAQAEFRFSTLVGSWAGEGSYYERPTRVRMRCRLSFAGNDAQLRMTGRCGSSLGAQALKLDFIRQGRNGVVVRPAPDAPDSDSDIAEMVGQIAGDLMIAAGSAGRETAKFQMETKPDGSLYFVTQREEGSFFSQSVITLRRR